MNSAAAVAVNPDGTSASESRVRWVWLWEMKSDLWLTFAPFWLGLAAALALYLTRDSGTSARDPGWFFSLGGNQFNAIALAYALYGPLIDGPHLWATISRTYVDAEEWAERRTLFISALLAFLLGPAVILLPFLINRFVPLSDEGLRSGMNVWGLFFTLYVTLHINRQHWGFVSLYRRKGGETDAFEAKLDSRYFQIGIWLPFVAGMFGPWGTLKDYSPPYLFELCHAAFVTLSIGYVAFQVSKWRRGQVRNGPKLLYVATILPLYYFTFACHPRLAAFWIMLTGVGHCIQYQGLVWTYGKKKYALSPDGPNRFPTFVFSKVWIYLGLGLLFSFATLRGPGGGYFSRLMGSWFASPSMTSLLSFLDASVGREVGVAVGAAFLAGLRVHHFYVDSKIWRVSKSKALAKNLAVG